MISFFWIVLCILVILYLRLSARLKRCEELIKEWKPQAPEPVKERPAPAPPLPEIPAPIKTSVPKSEVVASPPPKPVIPKAPVKTTKPFQIPAVIRENWIGVFGSVAIVIGAVFFGLTSEIMRYPEARVIAMILASMLFFGISLKLKQSPQWTLLCGWLRSIAATIILFATMGAGMIEGLQFIHSPVYIISFLCLGVVTNILLATTTPSQTVASLHVILSIIAFCAAPQVPILLPLGALVASIGLINAYRAKWDLHLLLIVMAFALQNGYWTFKLDSALFPWMHNLAIGCSLLIGLIAGCIHYSKKYASPKLEPLPLCAHLTNWVLLSWNIWLHTQSFKWASLILGSVAIVGFILARIAKRKGIFWLYYTDTLCSQLLALSAIASLGSFSVSPVDICLLILAETHLFGLIFQLHKENFLVKAGTFSQVAAFFATLLFAVKAITLTPGSSHVAICLRMGAAATICWSYYLCCRWKKFPFEDFRSLLLEKSPSKNPILLNVLLGTVFFALMSVWGFNSLLIQSLTFLMIAMISFWRKYREDASSNVVLIAALILVHSLNWIQLFGLCFQKSVVPSIFSNCNFLGLLILELFLIGSNFLEFKLWKKNLAPLLVYAFGLQTGLLIFVFTKSISLLIPGFAFLGVALLAVEIANRVSDHIKESVLQVGWFFLIGFIGHFATVHLQVNPIWHGIHVRWLTEALGMAVCLYWLFVSPKNSSYHPLTTLMLDLLHELCLGWITLCVLVEMPEMCRPLLWAVIASALVVGTLNFNWPKKLYVYSWFYFVASIVHTAFVTSTLKMPKLFLMEHFHLLTLLAIAFQCLYVCIVYRQQAKINSALSLTKTAFALDRYLHLTVLLPVFLGVALLFAFNFEKALLTLLWVGLICIYLSVGLVVKSKQSIQIGMGALLICSIRLIVLDLVQSNLSTRALVFIGVGGLMLGMSVLYKKYKHRLVAHEKV